MTGRAFCAVVVFAALGAPARALAQWPPDSLVNLRVFPEDIAVRDLVNTMRGFATALGVHCIHCHVGDDPNDLASTDFPSDDRVAKRKAREMIRMVRTINEELLANVPERSDPPIEVTCGTCHHGVSKPQDIRDVLRATARDGGLDSLKAQYARLKEEYYGSASYDFRPFMLANVAEEMGMDEADLALSILEYNITLHPADQQTFFVMARIYQRRRDRDAVIRTLERALDAMPDNEFFRRMLERVRG